MFIYRHVIPRRSTKAVTWVRMRKKKPVISRTGKFFCFNNNVYNLYKNSVVAKIYGMAYIFTLLMFRKPNKTTINKNKTRNFYRSTSFRFLFIFKYFKIFQVSQIFTCGLSDLLLVVFALREYILKVHILVNSEDKLCQIWNTCTVFFILLFKTNCLYFILQILLSRVKYTNYSVVTVAEWLDWSFESQNSLWKAQQWFETRKLGWVEYHGWLELIWKSRQFSIYF
jgi:hypothetical protein